jgi:replication factor C subunit 2/4
MDIFQSDDYNEEIVIENTVLNIPWIEKYRPKKIDDILLDDNVKHKTKELINNKIIPNIIMSGPPSTGKTSTASCIVKELLGDIKNNENIIELNASDNRGLEIIKTSIIHFCKKKVDISTCKIVMLDEADNITNKAQHMFNRLMEKYMKNTRFIFTCNDSSQIIESIQSRCVIFKFRKIPRDKLYQRLKYICQQEGITYTKGGLIKILLLAFDDIRQAINILEATFYGYGTVNKQNVEICFDHPRLPKLKKIIDHCIDKNIKIAISESNELMNKGNYNNNILLLMIRILKNISIDEDIRIKMISVINDVYLNISKGINTKLQLYDCLARMCSI